MDEAPEDYFEVNWFEQEIQNSELTRTKLGVEMQNLAEVWRDQGDDYQKQVGLSLLELLEWADTCEHHTQRRQ